MWLQVCELDIIFNFEKAYFLLDEFLMGGEVLETSKGAVRVSMQEADTLQEVLTANERSFIIIYTYITHVKCSSALVTDDGGVHEQAGLLMRGSRLKTSRGSSLRLISVAPLIF